MVYESRRRRVFVLGASTWRIEEITVDRVVVDARARRARQDAVLEGRQARPPARARPRARRARARARDALARDAADARLRDDAGSTRSRAANLRRVPRRAGARRPARSPTTARSSSNASPTRSATGASASSRRSARGCTRRGRSRSRSGSPRVDLPVQVLWSDDGIIFRLPESLDDDPARRSAARPRRARRARRRAPAEHVAVRVARSARTSARALLLPRRRPGERTPLWQQRQRAADLLEVAPRHPTFPMLLETTRECLRDVFDLPALREVLDRHPVAQGARRPGRDQRASPFAQSLLFGWIAVYMYEGDAPLAERRAAALALDRDLLRDLLGAEELRELLDPGSARRARARAAAARGRAPARATPTTSTTCSPTSAH